uniref:Uncharacterized protein n=1 Tax=Athene cunicularia TaxID=194338 RepID=A0A663MF62_ATHCN
RDSQAVAIKAWWWGQLVCQGLEVAPHSACHIQQRLRVLVAYVRQERASVLLQAHTRTWQARDQDWHCREAAHTIQAWRHGQSRGTARGHRCPWSRCQECGRPASPLAGCSRPC